MVGMHQSKFAFNDHPCQVLFHFAGGKVKMWKVNNNGYESSRKSSLGLWLVELAVDINVVSFIKKFTVLAFGKVNYR